MDFYRRNQQLLTNCKKRYCENFTKILNFADETIAFIQDIKKTD